MFRLICGCLLGYLPMVFLSCVYSSTEDGGTDRKGKIEVELNIRTIRINEISGISGQLTCVDETASDWFYPREVQERLYQASLLLAETCLIKDEEGRILLSLKLELTDDSAFTAWIDLTSRLCKVYRESGSDYLVLDLEVERVEAAGIVIRFTGWQTGGNGGTIINPS